MPTNHTDPSASALEARERLQKGQRRRELRSRLDDILLREKFIAIADALPNGRTDLLFSHRFTDAARKTDPSAPCGEDLRNVLADCLSCAVVTGTDEQIKTVVVHVLEYLDEIRAQVVSVLPKADVQPLAAVVISASKELTEAAHAVAVAGTTRNPVDVARAHKESTEAKLAMDAFQRSAIHHSSRRNAMAASV